MSTVIPFKPYLPKDRFQKRLTCVIAARGADGCVIVADTRVMRDYEASNQSKFKILWGRIAIAGAGTGLLLDELQEGLDELQVPPNTNFRVIRKRVEDVMKNIRDRYRSRLNEDFNLQAVLMGLEGFDKGDPELFVIHSQGVSERVETGVVFGHGDRPTAPMFRLLYNQMLTCEELAVLGWFAIANTVVLGIDQTVGMTQMGPECVVLRRDSEPTFLNPLDHPFLSSREALSNLNYRKKLIASVWEKIPMAYEGLLLEGQLPDYKLEELKEREIQQKLGIDGFDVFACESCSKRSWHPTRWRNQVKNCPYCGSEKVKYERTAIFPMH
jgi:20S proteasome alpha/beta subunit